MNNLIIKIVLIAISVYLGVGKTSAQSTTNVADLKQIQTRIFKAEIEKSATAISDDCKDSGGQSIVTVIDTVKGKQVKLEVVCFTSTKIQPIDTQVNSSSLSAGDVASVVGEALLSNSGDMASSAASSLPILGGFLSIIGAASSISESKKMVENSNKQMSDMMSSINQVKYEIHNPGNKTLVIRLRMYRVNQDQVLDSNEYQKQFDYLSRLLATPVLQ